MMVMHDEGPKKGRITAFSAFDGIGTVELDDGTRVRFGHHSLRGLEPTHLGPVAVREIREHGALGLCTFDVRDAELDELDRYGQRRLIARQVGESSEPRSHSGWAAVTFANLPPLAISDWDEVKDRLSPAAFDFKLKEVEYGLAGTVSLSGATMPIEVMNRPLDDTAEIKPPAFRGAHRGYVSILPTLLLTRDYRRRDPLGFPDPWSDGSTGWARAATLLVQTLLGLGGTSVHLPLAHCRKPANVFLAQVRDPRATEWRAWEAWLHGGRTDGGDFAIYGMEAHALPDVTVKQHPEVAFQELIKAGLTACQAMVYTNEELVHGEVIDVRGRGWSVEHRGEEIVLAAH